MRKILHLDLDAFFCAVEEKNNPSLIGKPFAVGGKPEARGVVASCSYAARRYGVRSAMPMARAVRLCPDLIIIPHSHGIYGQVSRQVMSLLRNISETIEQVSIDEAFLDVSDRPEPAADLARELQAAIRESLDLPCSLGVATNKLVAKIANDVGKTAAGTDGPPNAITVVPPGEEAEFLAPLPVEALWGVGPKTASHLSSLGIHTIGTLAAWPEEDLASRFGKLGHDLARRARGIDDRPLSTSREAKSVSKETTFAQDVHKAEILESTLERLCESVGRQLKRERKAGVTVRLKIRWPDFTTLTRQTTRAEPTDRAEEILADARTLLHAVWRPGRPVRLIGIGVSGLGPPIRQLSLWDNLSGPEASRDPQRERSLQETLARLQERYGVKVVWRGKKPQP